MKTIYLKDTVAGTGTNAEGFSLYILLKTYFDTNEVVFVSFANTTAMSSSFFNSSFGELIEKYGLNKFREIVRPTEITKSQMELIRKYINWHTQNYKS